MVVGNNSPCLVASFYLVLNSGAYCEEDMQKDGLKGCYK